MLDHDKQYQSENLQPEIEEKQTAPTKKPLPLWPAGEIVWILLMGIGAAQLPYVLSPNGNQLGMMLLSYLLQYACFLLLPVLSVVVIRRLPAAILGLRPASWKLVLLSFGWGLLLYGMGQLAAVAETSVLPQSLLEEQEAVALLDFAENRFELALVIVFLCTVSPLCEEMLFRAYLLPPLLATHRRGAGAYVVGAVIFSLVHMNVLTAFPLFLAGLGFCWLYDRYRNLLYNVVAHAAWNLVAVVIYCCINL